MKTLHASGKQFSFVSFLFLLFLGSTSLSAQESNYYGGEVGKKLDWVMYYLDAYYVDSTANDSLAELAITRMMETLDPFSYYQSKQAMADQRKRDGGYKNDGIGFKYYVVNDTATVTIVDAEGPAERAGIRKGDKILTVNGVNIVGENFAHVDSLLTAEAGTEVALELKRARVTEPLELKITSAELVAKSVVAVYPITARTGYVKIDRFTVKTNDEFVQAVEDLRAAGVEHLILDLRNNRGGVVDAATDLADQFLPAGKLIMASEGRGMPRKEIVATEDGVFERGKVAVLTDGVTASASEILTGALRDWDRAIVIGEPTYGKGLVQQSYLLNDSSALRLTIGRYYTPTGHSLQRPFGADPAQDWIGRNIATTDQHNGFTRDLPAPVDFRGTTQSGRAILRRAGGIVPDLYLPKKTVEKPQVDQLIKLGLLYKFAVYHADRYRSELTRQYANGNAFRLDEAADEKIATRLALFVAANLSDQTTANQILRGGIAPETVQLAKAWIATQIWELGDYYAVMNDTDYVIQRAVSIIQDTTFGEMRLSH